MLEKVVVSKVAQGCMEEIARNEKEIAILKRHVGLKHLKQDRIEWLEARNEDLKFMAEVFEGTQA